MVKYLVIGFNNKTAKRERFYNKLNGQFGKWNTYEDARKWAAENVEPWIYTSVEVIEVDK